MQVCGFQSRPILLAKKIMMALSGTDRWLSPLSFHYLGVCINYKVHYKNNYFFYVFFLLSLQYYHRVE